MSEPTRPPPKFQRFERVLIATDSRGDRFEGQQGTIIWCDPPWLNLRTHTWSQWIYCVHIAAMDCYPNELESHLLTTGEFDDERSQLGTGYEISFDTVIDDENDTVEGTYRLPGQLWAVFVFMNEEVPALEHSIGTWKSGVTGLGVKVPVDTRISKEFMIKVMSDVFGSADWVVVSGPASFVMR